MAIGHAYTTAVHDTASDLSAEIATIGLDAIADQQLAGLLRGGYAGDFLGALTDLDVAVSRVDVDLGALTQNSSELRILLGAALTSATLEEAEDLWRRRVEPGEAVTGFIQQLLDAVVLAEHSDPEADKALRQIGITATHGAGLTAVALVAHGAGIGIIIAGTGGVAGVGLGVGLVVYGVLRRRRRSR